MSKQKSYKVIKCCPVCHSTKIRQRIRYFPFIDTGDETHISGDGSHCLNCGVKFAFNTDHLEKDLKEEGDMIRRAKEKAKKEFEMEQSK